MPLTANDTCARLLAELRGELAEQERSVQHLRISIAMLEARIEEEAEDEQHRYEQMTTREAARAVLQGRAGTPMTNADILEAMMEGGWRSNSNRHTPGIVTRALVQLRDAGEIRKVGHGRYIAPVGANPAGDWLEQFLLGQVPRSPAPREVIAGLLAHGSDTDEK